MHDVFKRSGICGSLRHHDNVLTVSKMMEDRISIILYYTQSLFARTKRGFWATHQPTPLTSQVSISYQNWCEGCRCALDGGRIRNNALPLPWSNSKHWARNAEPKLISTPATQPSKRVSKEMHIHTSRSRVCEVSKPSTHVLDRDYKTMKTFLLLFIVLACLYHKTRNISL